MPVLPYLFSCANVKKWLMLRQKTCLGAYALNDIVLCYYAIILINMVFMVFFRRLCKVVVIARAVLAADAAPTLRAQDAIALAL